MTLVIGTSLLSTALVSLIRRLCEMLVETRAVSNAPVPWIGDAEDLLSTGMMSVPCYNDVIIAVQFHVSVVKKSSGFLVFVLFILLVQVVQVLAVFSLEAAFHLHLAKTAQHVGAPGVLPPDQGGGSVDSEAVDPGNVALCALGRHQGRVHLEHDVVERGTKVGTVDGCVPRRLGVVDILASGAVQLDRLLVGHVGLAHRKQRVRVTEDARALSEIGLLVLVKL